jgi:hypothetical protein
LILTIEFDPYFGFQQKEKVEYFYYGEDNWVKSEMIFLTMYNVQD